MLRSLCLLVRTYGKKLIFEGQLIEPYSLEGYPIEDGSQG